VIQWPNQSVLNRKVAASLASLFTGQLPFAEISLGVIQGLGMSDGALGKPSEEESGASDRMLLSERFKRFGGLY